VVALRHLATEHSRATGDNISHHPALASREAMRLLVSLAIGAKDIRDLHPLTCPVCGVTPGPHGSSVHKPGIIQQFQGRWGLEQMLPGDVKVPERGLKRGMSHQPLDRVEIHAGL
jgi:hypothetical protein